MSDFPYLPLTYWFQFPDVEGRNRGIVAEGGNLSPGMLFSAYNQGIFPWYNEGEPVQWWSPNPRFVLLPQELHIPKSLQKTMKKQPFIFTMNKAFREVIKNCASTKREGQSGTWITADVIEGYSELHSCGLAHSFEAWKLDNDGKENLVGGLYGVQMGQVFCGESMFSKEKDASKCAFVNFVQHFISCGGKLIDCQVYTDNLARFGAKNVSRDVYMRMLKDYKSQDLDRKYFKFP